MRLWLWRLPQTIEKSQDALSKFRWLVAEGCRVPGAGNAPKLLWTFGGAENHFTVAAGKRVVFLIADYQDGERAGSNGFNG